MHQATKWSAPFALGVLLGAIAAPAQADKPVQLERPGQSNAAPANPARHAAAEPAARSKAEGHAATLERGTPGKSTEAQAAAPGQIAKHGEDDVTKERGKDEGVEQAPARVRANDELRQTRAARQREARTKLEGRYGVELLARAPLRAELKTHAWRMARLERMQALAESIPDATKRNKTIERLNRLVAKETERHDRRMDQLQFDETGNTANAKADNRGAGKPEKVVAAKHVAKPDSQDRAVATDSPKGAR